MSNRTCYCIILSVAILLCMAFPLQAQWVTDGAAVSAEMADQQFPQLTTDGADGAIITWEDWRTYYRNVGVARINAFGYLQWTYNILVGLAAGDSLRPQITSDSLGGAIVTWHDARNGNYDIYAQRILANGTKHDGWPVGGVGVCVLDSAQVDPRIVSDGVGGAIIAWEDKRGEFFNVYAQRIDAGGGVHAEWTANGIIVSQTYCDQGWIELAPDTENGAIITWTDLSGEEPPIGGDIYAQRVLGNGTVGPFSWVSNGTAICKAVNDQVYPKIIPDGAGGAIITWSDKRVNNHDDIYAQRIDADGAIHAGNWKNYTNGVPICVYDERQRIPELASDGAEGAIITWMDSREGTDDWDIYVRGIDANGVTWDSAVCVAGATNEQKVPEIVSDGAGGAIIVWRHGLPGFYDIYARRVLHDGTMSTDPVWPAGGVAVCTATQGQSYLQVVPSGIGGALVTWNDHRNANNFDIYAQRIPPPSCEVTYDFVYSDTLWQEEFLFGCPQGDAYELRVAVDFDDIETISFFGPSYTIPASDITIDAVDEPYIFWNEGDIIAQGPAAAPSYTDTIEHSCVSGCGTADIPVRLIGMVVGSVGGLAVRSPDFTGNPYGAVNLSDLAKLGLTYMKSLGDPGYNECFDFNPNDTINKPDLTLFGAHYTDQYPFLGSAIPPHLEKGLAYNMSLTAVESIDTDPDGTTLVTLSLAVTRDITTVALGIDPGLEGLEYRGWTPNPAFPGTPVALTIDHDGRNLVFVAALNMQPKGDGEIELGTIEFALQGKSGGYTAPSEGLPFVFAEALDTGGKIRRIQLSGSDGHDVPPPLVTRLGDNYPNPFNPTTTIEYSLARDAHVSLAIYNVRGERVRTLVDAFQKRNEYRAVWDGTDANGNEVASGVYFYRLKTDGFAESKKLVLLR